MMPVEKVVIWDDDEKKVVAIAADFGIKSLSSVADTCLVTISQMTETS